MTDAHENVKHRIQQLEAERKAAQEAASGACNQTLAQGFALMADRLDAAIALIRHQSETIARLTAVSPVAVSGKGEARAIFEAFVSDNGWCIARLANGNYSSADVNGRWLCVEKVLTTLQSPKPPADVAEHGARGDLIRRLMVAVSWMKPLVGKDGVGIARRDIAAVEEAISFIQASALSASRGQADCVTEVIEEVRRATTKFPTWPTDPLHALGVLAEEKGELDKEVLQLVYEPHKSSKEAVRKEAIQCAAMALRFVMSLERYEYAPLPQHSQG